MDRLVTDEQLAAYRRDGFVHLAGLFAPELVSRARAELDRLSNEQHNFKRHPEAGPRGHATGNPVFDRVEPVCPLSAVFERMTAEPTMLEAVAALLGQPAGIFKDKMIFKPPGTDGYLLHQDYPYWAGMGVPADEMLTVMVAFDVADAESGGLELFSGLHGAALPAPAGEPRDADPASVRGRPSRVVACEPGDAVAFHSLVPHRSAANRSNHPRRCWFTSWITGRWGNRYTEVYGERLAGYRPPAGHPAFDPAVASGPLVLRA